MSAVCLFTGAALSQLWSPAFGIGLAAYGFIGATSGNLLMVGPLSHALEGRAERPIGVVAVVTGVAAAWWSFARAAA